MVPEQDPPKPGSWQKVFRDHPRRWRQNVYVYPVISRRSGGLSIGINLNPDKVCNFRCVYCQVDRRGTAGPRHVHIDALADELEAMLELVTTGALWREPAFAEVPERFRRIADIAFSGDGEPTNSPAFPEAVRVVVDAKRRSGLTDVKIRVLTNASCLDRPEVKQALALLDEAQGEIWAKLDAGSESYFRLLNRADVPFSRVLANILATARVRPIVIQSLWVCLHGQTPQQDQIEAFAQRLTEILQAGGSIRRVQIYTMARPPAESFVTAVANPVLDWIAGIVRQRTGLCVETYHGVAG